MRFFKKILLVFLFSVVPNGLWYCKSVKKCTCLRFFSIFKVNFLWRYLYVSSITVSVGNFLVASSQITTNFWFHRWKSKSNAAKSLKKADSYVFFPKKTSLVFIRNTAWLSTTNESTKFSNFRWLFKDRIFIHIPLKGIDVGRGCQITQTALIFLSFK